jgi:SAM-dependent methyltransferase
MKCLMCSAEQRIKKFTYNGLDPYMDKLGVDFDLNWYECGMCGVYFSKQYHNIDQVYEDELLYDASYDKLQIKERYQKILSLPKSNSDNYKRVNRCVEYFDLFRELRDSHSDLYDVLDIGAGLGVFLAELKKDPRFQVKALELNKVAAYHIQENLNIKTYQNFMQKLDFDGAFDLITLNRVVEHIKTPIEVMISAKKALKDNGLIYIELPDVLSFILDGDSNEAFASGHYMVYGPQSIQYLFDKAKIELYAINRVKEPSGKYTIYALGGKE